MIVGRGPDGCRRYAGRTVWGFVSGIDTGRDVSCEVFYLEPVPYE